MPSRICAGALGFLVTWHASAVVQGSDYFLTIGGGYSPLGNQVSLEKNVLMFQRLVAGWHPDGASHSIFFSDGDNPGRDLQYHDPELVLPRAHWLIARVLRSTNYLEYEYRDHRIAHVQGESSRENLDRWFNQTGRTLKAGDRLTIYVTAHGGRAEDKKRPQDTRLYLWNNQKILMSEFVSHLDVIAPEVPVVLIMVQCYAGGFANIVFNEGDPGKGFSPANRCGFFATLHDRPAAGCTADIDEENYQEYSSYFWAALAGLGRDGKPVEGCDYDGDGIVSLAEAHAYALLTSDTIDVSVKTSDAFLREFSCTKAAEGDAKQQALAEAGELVGPEFPCDQLLALASPLDRAVIEGLSRQLNLSESARYDAVKSLAERLSKDRKAVEGRQQRTTNELNAIGKRIESALKNSWPELANRWHPRVGDILQQQSAEVIDLIQSHREYSHFETVSGQLGELEQRELDLDRRWAKCQRLLRLLENVALAANLTKVASSETCGQYERLSLAEAGTLVPVAAVDAPSASSTSTGSAP